MYILTTLKVRRIQTKVYISTGCQDYSTVHLVWRGTACFYSCIQSFLSPELSILQCVTPQFHLVNTESTLIFPHEENHWSAFASCSTKQRQIMDAGLWGFWDKHWMKAKRDAVKVEGQSSGTSCCWHDTKVWKPGATPNPSWSMKGGSSWLWIWTLMPAS